MRIRVVELDGSVVSQPCLAGLIAAAYAGRADAGNGRTMRGRPPQGRDDLAVSDRSDARLVAAFREVLQ